MPRRDDLTYELLFRLHHTEKRSVLEMSRLLRAKRDTIMARMDVLNIPRRNASEATQVVMAKTSAEVRKQNIANAIAARTGVKNSRESAIQRARTIQEIQKLSTLERAFFAAFAAAHLPLIPQLALDKFNLDFGNELYKVAVEIDGGWGNTPRRVAQAATKDTFLLSQGWVILRFTARKLNRAASEVEVILRERGWRL